MWFSFVGFNITLECITMLACEEPADWSGVSGPDKTPVPLPRAFNNLAVNIKCTPLISHPDLIDAITIVGFLLKTTVHD